MVEFGRNDLEEIIEKLVKRSKKNKQNWKITEYHPITINFKRNDISHEFSAKTELLGQILWLDFVEKINLSNEKGDIIGKISYNGQYGKQYYKFGLSYDWEKYNLCTPQTLYYKFRDSDIIQLSDILIVKLISELHIQVNQSPFKKTNVLGHQPMIALANRLTRENKILEFHKCVLDIDYRLDLIKNTDKTI